MSQPQATLAPQPAITPPPQATSSERPWHLLVLSAASDSALLDRSDALADLLEDQPDLDLDDLAYTLQLTDPGAGDRQTVLCQSATDAVSQLDARLPQQVRTATAPAEPPPLIFLFPGGGTQYVNMGVELYPTEPVLRRHVDHCAELFRAHLGTDFRTALFPAPGQEDAAREAMQRTSVALPALFAMEYAVARLWLEWGIRPAAMIGHSLGEYVAACLAGVLRLEDAVLLVALRGQLIEDLPSGAMLSVPLPEAELRGLMDERLSIAAVNGPARCVVSGPEEAVAELEARLKPRGLETRTLAIKAAGHSTMVDPILDRFAASLQQLQLAEPRIPYVSNVTGGWIGRDEALDPSYWVRHLRQTVRFADGLKAVRQRHRQPVLLEVGPGRALTTLAMQDPAGEPELHLTSLPHPGDTLPSTVWLPTTLGRLWLAGVAVDWPALYAGTERTQLELPPDLAAAASTPIPATRPAAAPLAPKPAPELNVARSQADRQKQALQRQRELAKKRTPTDLPTP